MNRSCFQCKKSKMSEGGTGGTGGTGFYPTTYIHTFPCVGIGTWHVLPHLRAETCPLARPTLYAYHDKEQESLGKALKGND